MNIRLSLSCTARGVDVTLPLTVLLVALSIVIARVMWAQVPYDKKESPWLT